MPSVSTQTSSRRSSTPSPLTSPAVLTALPDVDARELEAIGAIEGREIDVATVPHPRTAEDHIARTGGARDSSPGAPMRRSSIPSPLTSPAVLTATPE